MTNPVAPWMQTPCQAQTAAKVMVNGDVIFTVSGGPIQILNLMSTCITANDSTASTLQYNSTPTYGSAKTFSGASASLGSATVGTTAILTPTALTTAPTLVTGANGGVQLGLVAQNHITVLEGTITVVIGVGSTTGTWRHSITYLPMAPGVTVN
jgi:hypothetical protein